MVKVRTPYRVSFAGGGTDLLEYSRKFGGAAVGCSIDRYITSSFSGSGDFQVHSDLPTGSGLGGSAAYLSSIYRSRYPAATKYEVVQHVTESEKLGQQDQIMCVFGGLRFITFAQDDSYSTLSIPVPEWLNRCMSIYYLGDRKVEGHTLLTGLNEDALKNQIELARMVFRALKNGDYNTFVDCMKEAWEEKKRFRPDLLTDDIRGFEERTRIRGTRAFKLCGAGGGGYALLIHEPDESRFGIPIKVDRAGQVIVSGE